MNESSLSTLPSWANYLAQDADGQWWAYETEPNLSHISWYENEVGQLMKLKTGSPNPEWKKTLKKIQKI